jgi:hypothetical protein
MTSLRQIEANRRNAIRSTGPSTEQGKRRSRRNALRHGLCAETVIDDLEDIEDYRAFEAAIIADYDARTVVERELVLRLASLLWRLRRATAIETELLRIQAEILRERREDTREQANPEPVVSFRIVSADIDEATDDSDPQAARTFPVDPTPMSRELAHCFQRLAIFDNGLFERLGRYENALWRQTMQILFAIQPIRR